MQGDYPNYSVNDFVWDEDFRKWVLQPTEAADRYWAKWVALHPDCKADIEAAREIVLSMKFTQTATAQEDRDFIIDEIIQKATGRSKKQFNGLRIAIAAAFFCLLIAGVNYLAQNYKASNTKVAERVLEFRNDRDTVVALKLPDGTVIVLDSGAALKIDSLFNSSDRKVYLTGNAFFNVSKDSLKPFYVYCSNIETKVLGTSFKIQSDPIRKNIKVIVHSGIVSVSKPGMTTKEKPDATSVVVTRNQQADYSTATGQLSKTIMANPVESDENFVSFIYEARPVYSIFSDLEKAYSINVSYDKAVVPNYEFSGNLQGKTLQEKMKVICYALGFHYEIKDAQIFVY